MEASSNLLLRSNSKEPESILQLFIACLHQQTVSGSLDIRPTMVQGACGIDWNPARSQLVAIRMPGSGQIEN